MSSEDQKQLLEGYLTPDEFKDCLARFYGGKRVPDRTMRRWMQKRTAPPRIRVGRLVMYRIADVKAWLDRNLEGGEPRPQRRRGNKRQKFTNRSAA
jgi:hypothetical protein